MPIGPCGSTGVGHEAERVRRSMGQHLIVVSMGRKE